MDTWLSGDIYFLKFGWSQIAKSGMASLPIIKNFDIVKDFRSGLLPGVIMPSMNQFRLKSVEETFPHSNFPSDSYDTGCQSLSVRPETHAPRPDALVRMVAQTKPWRPFFSAMVNASSTNC